VDQHNHGVARATSLRRTRERVARAWSSARLHDGCAVPGRGMHDLGCCLSSKLRPSPVRGCQGSADAADQAESAWQVESFNLPQHAGTHACVPTSTERHTQPSPGTPSWSWPMLQLPSHGVVFRHIEYRHVSLPQPPWPPQNSQQFWPQTRCSCLFCW
jgi:hypothetical protein